MTNSRFEKEIHELTSLLYEKLKLTTTSNSSKTPLLRSSCVQEWFLNLSWTVKDLEPWINRSFEGYHRQVLYQNKSVPEYEIVVITWLPRQSTPIHGHPEGGCVFRIFQGLFQEEQFCVSDEKEETIKTRILEKTDQVYYIDDSLGRHRMTCLLSSLKEKDEVGITLHMYQPPFCRMNHSS